MRVIRVDPGGLADRYGLRVGDVLCSINGEPIGDPIDYRFHAADEVLELLVERAGRSRVITLRRALDEDLGIVLEDMKIRVCPNRCIFCFVDQLPLDMRPTLYLKDDDYRLSFLHGAYVTLVGLEADQLHRIVRQRLSPLYISIHATSPELRCRMMGNGEAGDVLESIRFLTDNGIELLWSSRPVSRMERRDRAGSNSRGAARVVPADAVSRACARRPDPVQNAVASPEESGPEPSEGVCVACAELAERVSTASWGALCVFGRRAVPLGGS